MIDFIFDTETTGLWKFKLPDNDPSQPRLVQVAGVLLEGSRVLATLSTLVKHEGMKIEPGAAAVHGITTEDCEFVGLTSASACRLWTFYASRANRIVAHNMAFDRKVMKHEMAATRVEDNIFGGDIAEVCTMVSATPVLALPGRYGKHKWPKLIEAYKALVNPDGFEGAHDALVDVRACVEVLRALEDGGHEIKEV